MWREHERLPEEYKFNAYAYREGRALARLVFTNPKTEEYLTVEVPAACGPSLRVALERRASLEQSRLHLFLNYIGVTRDVFRIQRRYAESNRVCVCRNISFLDK